MIAPPFGNGDTQKAKAQSVQTGRQVYAMQNRMVPNEGYWIHRLLGVRYALNQLSIIARTT
jgi:hypothetical protein